MFKSISKYFYFSFIPLAVLGLVSICLFALSVIPSYYLLITALAWVLIAGLGIAVGYHRVFSHKTHTIPPWKENILLFFGALAGQGSSLTWVALHRGRHHPYADTERDLHSPVVHSPLHAFVGWSLAVVENNNPISMKYAVDLIRKPNHMWFHDNHYMVLYGVYSVVFMVNWQLGFALLLASFIGIMQDNLVNVVGHRKALIGYRNYDTSDNSQNNFVLGFLGWGQGWHNNHHAAPAQYNFGGVRWWELDPCIIFLPLLNSPSK